VHNKPALVFNSRVFPKKIFEVILQHQILLRCPYARKALSVLAIHSGKL